MRTFVRPCTVSIWQPAFSSAVHSDRVSSSFGSTRILHLFESVGLVLVALLAGVCVFNVRDWHIKLCM